VSLPRCRLCMFRSTKPSMLIARRRREFQFSAHSLYLDRGDFDDVRDGSSLGSREWSSERYGPRHATDGDSWQVIGRHRLRTRKFPEQISAPTHFRHAESQKSFTISDLFDIRFSGSHRLLHCHITVCLFDISGGFRPFTTSRMMNPGLKDLFVCAS
jgi:hypothetical protein